MSIHDSILMLFIMRWGLVFLATIVLTILIAAVASIVGDKNPDNLRPFVIDGPQAK